MSSFFILQCLVIVLSLLRWTDAGFVQSQSCSSDLKGYLLEPFIIDVALDEVHKKLKFLINSQVKYYPNMSDTDIMISDVNYTTNRYTTFHIEVDFMGKTFIKENKRFCDVLAVKNTTDFMNSPRFPQPPAPETAPYQPASDKYNSTINAKRGVFAKREDIENPSLAINGTFFNTSLPETDAKFSDSWSEYFTTNNETIERLFSNSTGSLVQCPLYVNDSIVFYYEADISSHFHTLGSYSVRFSVVSNDLSSQLIGCNKVYVTPVQPDSISGVLLLGILMFLLVTAILNILIVVYSSYQESSNPFLFKASTICNEELLKQLDTTVPGIIMYLQFALFIGGLDLQYPGFYQPLIGQIRWCALLGVSILHRSVPETVTRMDNIYSTMNTGGLKSLTLFTSDKSILNNWPNFILCLIIVVGIIIAIQQSFLVLKILFSCIAKKFNIKKNCRKPDSDQINFTFKKNLYFIVGQALDAFLIIFGFPFLVFTSFMFTSAGDIRNKNKQYPSITALTNISFSNSSSYDQLIIPTDRSKILQTNNITVAGVNVTSFLDPSLNFTNVTTTIPNSSDWSTVASVSLAIGSILFALWVGLVGYFTFNYLISFKKFGLVRSKKISKLYTSMKTILLWSFFYNHYHPNKVYYVIIDIWSVLLKSLVIGLLQDHGSIQVACLIILEFLDLVLLFTIRPYFVKLSWVSSKSFLPLARVFVTILCIPYIRPLQLSEASRTYVAYVQLLIHLVVAIVFLIQLFYSFTKTIISIIRHHREKKEGSYNSKLASTESKDEFDMEFEYHPVDIQLKPSLFPTIDITSDNSFVAPKTVRPSYGVPLVGTKEPKSLSSTIYDFAFNHSSNNVKPLEVDDEEDDDKFYYRARNDLQSNTAFKDSQIAPEKVKLKRHFSEKTLLNKINESEDRDLSTNYEDSPNFSDTDLQSFAKEQQFSNLRKERNDYKVREGDQIYKKYFIDDSIDPEVKALWDSRPNWGGSTQTSSSDDNQPQQVGDEKLSSFFDKVKLFTNKLLRRNVPEAKQSGFQVLRPRQLVIKTLSEVHVLEATESNTSSHSNTSSNGSSSSSPMCSARSVLSPSPDTSLK
ncbi:hypothetical protein G9P44_003626 [Scheffersomyces stipitis]|nr:hypothetical protein G9P44_003626 [Scheffersomyces stipitis]